MLSLGTFGCQKPVANRRSGLAGVKYPGWSGSEKSNCAGIVAADILSAVGGGILPPGPTLDFPRFSNLSAGSAGLEAPALRQAEKPAATFIRHALTYRCHPS